MKVRMFCRYTLIALLNFTLISASFAQRADMKIAFVSTRDGNREIYVMDADGKNLKNLTNSPGNDIFPVWSPDGKKIAYISGNLGDGNSLEVFVMNADGSNPKNLTKNRAEEFEWPAWSPDGKKIAFQSYRDFNGEIYVMDADGGNPKNLTKAPGVGDGSPAWSPDGKKIAFVSRRDGNSEVYVMNADGTDQRNLTKHPANDRIPSWSKDGRQIFFWSNRGANEEPLKRYMVLASGGNSIKSPAPWGVLSPDGKLIAFASGANPNSEIFVVNTDGSNPRNLTNSPGNDWSPAWAPIHGLAVSPSHKLTTTWGYIKRQPVQ